MIRTLILAAAALALSAPAAAGDRRIAARFFNVDEVVQITGQAGVQTSIAFAEDERIENVAIGDSTSWQITPNKRANLLFVKPLSPRARTNMTVVTDKRTYFFDLIASPTAQPLYMVRFTYPDEPKAVVEQAENKTPTLNPAESSVSEGDQPLDPAKLNFAWTKRGDAKLYPSQVYDDGTSTYLSWPVGAAQPAVLIRDEKGTEGPVNYAVRGDMIVIEGVPAAILLRSGKSSALLEFRGPATGPVAKKGN